MGKNDRTIAGSVFDHLPSAGNEVFSPAGRKESHYRKCLDGLARLSDEQLLDRQRFADRATNELGLHADRMREGRQTLGAFQMDIFPRILRPREWKQIEAGVLQRVSAFGSFISDIHAEKKILIDGIIPPELVFEDPSFHPELHNIPVDENCPITVGAMDLLRTPSGEWKVLENRFSTPTGISYVIQARRIQAQALPELFEALPVYPVASFATRLSEALAEMAGPVENGQALAVLLSEGEKGRHFFEESFLARHMGIPLTLPEDMVVRDGYVFLKTINGLMRVHCIYRRLEPRSIDPVAFASTNESGIPGLVQCVRKGSIKILNALGCAVADNRSLLRHSNDIIRYYTGKQAILQTVPTFHGYDPDQVEWIRDNLDQVSLKTVSHPETLVRTRPETRELVLNGKLKELLMMDPRLVVAQQLPESSKLPVYREGKVTLEETVLRVFFITGKRPYVLPGGLTRLARPGSELLASGEKHHSLKDTWALQPEKNVSTRPGTRLERGIGGTEYPLPSRAAEAFYWMGRYLERASSTARMLKTLEELRWSELTPKERELYAPLWKGIIEATGAEKSRRKMGSINSDNLVEQLLTDERNPASAKSCMLSVHLNASRIRSLITPEVWNGIRNTCDLFSNAEDDSSGNFHLGELMQSVVDSGDIIHGAASRTLLRDAGWYFLESGMLIERGLNNTVILSVVLPYIAKRQWEHLRDDTDLTALLRLLGALDAYHRKYRSRAYLDRVVALLWRARDFTGSAKFTTSTLRDNLSRIRHYVSSDQTQDALDSQTEVFLSWLDGLSLEEMFPARTLELDKGLTRTNLPTDKTIDLARKSLKKMMKFYESFHMGLEDRYFSHHLPGKADPR
ncbi:circularly permuted type 2 ATP-grasp protein [Puniceicoccales bacterium CK1056]|uniref:Circularly permuted type 2 ATP-grasp protein n=1 Tax=Oceanipulchritudo coccoides TaxID=2706888 RepID=A0A6B2LXB4_9BACT|nr:circularly permuted type 2 ATP-grasp protein [Oceanipulchritudo coccoides]NDV61181.1 circularly permuted type 2 ATP-grasp protein [Oceanipulchritudo coccoides]